MPRTCTICQHPQRAEIEAEMVAGTALRNIAERFSCSGTTSLHRHKAHIKQAVADARARQTDATAMTVRAHLSWLRQEAHDLYHDARSGKIADRRLALSALSHLLKQDELIGELEGELDRSTHVDIHQHPEWINMRELIFQALEPYPEALVAVAQALHQEAKRGRHVA